MSGDVLALLSATERASREFGPVVTMSMGALGKISRAAVHISAPVLLCRWKNASAPGQISAEDLKAVLQDLDLGLLKKNAGRRFAECAGSQVGKAEIAEERLNRTMKMISIPFLTLCSGMEKLNFGGAKRRNEQTQQALESVQETGGQPVLFPAEQYRAADGGSQGGYAGFGPAVAGRRTEEGCSCRKFRQSEQTDAAFQTAEEETARKVLGQKEFALP